MFVVHFLTLCYNLEEIQTMSNYIICHNLQWWKIKSMSIMQNEWWKIKSTCIMQNFTFMSTHHYTSTTCRTHGAWSRRTSAGEGKLVVHIQLHHHHLRLILSTHLPVRQAVEIKNKWLVMVQHAPFGCCNDLGADWQAGPRSVVAYKK
jgi:hypothetical protein